MRAVAVAGTKSLCAVPMPNARELCARFKGHRGEHRTRWAMNNELMNPRPALRLPFLVILGPARCRGCQRTVWYGKSANSIRDLLPAIWRDPSGQRHQCRRQSAVA